MLIARGGLSDILKHLKTKPKKSTEMCQHGKTNMSYTEFLNIAKNWPNLAPVLRIWCKKYLSGKSGGERKKYPSANPVHHMNSMFSGHLIQQAVSN